MFFRSKQKQDPDGEQYNEQQQLTCAATGGSFTLTFRGFTTDAISYSASSEDIVAALQNLPSLYGAYDTAVSVQFSSSSTQTACTSGGHSWTIEFLQDFGDLPLLVAGVSKLTHSTSGVSASVDVEEAVTGTKESLDCSGRGLCDTDDRLCTCETEFDTSNGYNEEVNIKLLFMTRGQGRSVVEHALGWRSIIVCMLEDMSHRFPPSSLFVTIARFLIFSSHTNKNRKRILRYRSEKFCQKMVALPHAWIVVLRVLPCSTGGAHSSKSNVSLYTVVHDTRAIHRQPSTYRM